LVRLMQHMPRGDRLEWQRHVQPDLSVEMDPHDFGEVMGNLLDNARKWARSRVMITADATGETAIITVVDDGPGFSEGADGGRPERGMTGRADPGSSGLGLGIVEDILAEYGARPEINGQGRCHVSFEVPLRSHGLTGQFNGTDATRTSSKGRSDPSTRAA
jgi:signal transduction histidine kinase